MVFNIIMLSSKSVRVRTMLYSINESMDSIRRSAVPIGVRIDRAEVPKLKGIADSGLEGDRYEIGLNSFYGIDYRIVLTRNGDGTVLCFSSSHDDTGTGIFRFVLKDVWTDTGDAATCDLVRIYGEDMVFIQLIAGGPFTDSSEKRSLRERLRDVKERSLRSGNPPDRRCPRLYGAWRIRCFQSVRFRSVGPSRIIRLEWYYRTSELLRQSMYDVRRHHPSEYPYEGNRQHRSDGSGGIRPMDIDTGLPESARYMSMEEERYPWENVRTILRRTQEMKQPG
jgi:hypothetical protein